MLAFTNTKNALKNLQCTLQCRKCNSFQMDVFTLGQCEHRFCRSCAEDNQGKVCPVCGMPSHATQAHLDKQLSNIVALCQQVSNLLNSTETLSALERDHYEKSCQSQSELEATPPKNGLRCENNSDQGVKQSSRKKRLIQQGEEDTTKMQLKRENNNQHSVNTATNFAKYQTIDNKLPSVRKGGNSEELNDTNTTHENLLNKRDGDQVHAITKCNGGEEKVVCSRTPDSAKRSKMGTPKTKSKSKGQRSDSLPLPQGHALSEVCLEPRRRGRKSGSVNNDLLNTTPQTPKHKGSRTNRRNMKSTPVNNSAKPKTQLTKRNAKGETPLQVATIKADVITVRKLLQDGANPNVRDNAGWTPLHEAVNHGNAEIAELLISHGAAVNSPGLDNDTPLHDAVSNYRLDCVRLLVSKGANALTRNIHGKTPLDLAQTDEMRELLLTVHDSSVTASADVSMIEEDDQQPLCFLASTMSREKQVVLQKCAKLLHAKTLNDFASEVSHLITGVNDEGMCPRNFKYMSAILAGKWVVNTEWLGACLDYGKRVSEEAFEVTGCSTNPDTLAPQRARHNRLQQLPGLFDGCQFFFHGKFNYPTPSRETLVNLVKQGGGIILTREPRLHNLDDYPYTVPFHASASSSLADCAIFVVYDDTCPDPPKVEAQRMSCLPVSWLMDSIASFTLLDKCNYLK